MAKTKTKTKAKAKPKVSALDRIGGKATKKATSITPQIVITDDSQLEAIAEILDAKAKLTEATSAFETAELGFKDDATDLYENRCRKDGTRHSSVQFLGTLNQDEDSRPVSVKLVAAARMKGKMHEDEASDAMHSAFGSDYDDLFTSQRTIEIDVNKLTDDQIDKLIGGMEDALGDSFDDAVSVNKFIVPQPAFYGRRILDAKIRAKTDNAVADGYAKVSQPYFKIG
jgi:hypothetical protein